MDEQIKLDQSPKEKYLVVVNDEGQYSIWQADRPVPNGWRSYGMSGSQDDCLAHIEKVWTDMRPLSIRSHNG